MMSDLFSSMDNKSSLLSLSFMFFLCFLLSTSIWKLNLMTTFNRFGLSLLEMKTVKWNNINLIIVLLLIFIIGMNLLGLFPYSYGPTTSLWINSSMALIMWSLMVISGIMFKPTNFIANFAPSGAPMLLVPILIIIEFISCFIRPITLTVRLVANLSAGHIILALLANVLNSIFFSVSGMTVIIILIFYNLFEFFVCFIQGYIFTLLLSLYVQEHP